MSGSLVFRKSLWLFVADVWDAVTKVFSAAGLVCANFVDMSVYYYCPVIANFKNVQLISISPHRMHLFSRFVRHAWVLIFHIVLHYTSRLFVKESANYFLSHLIFWGLKFVAQTCCRETWSSLLPCCVIPRSRNSHICAEKGDVFMIAKLHCPFCLRTKAGVLP